MGDAPNPDPAGDGITITRVLDAPRELVWKEWTEPERFADWFGGSASEVLPASVSMDVRPGGGWRATMLPGAGHDEIHWRGAYSEVVEPERLAFTITDRPDEEEYELVTVVLTDLGDGRTEMVVRQSGGHLSPQEYERAGQGWSSFFDRMDERLAG
jgi:uncharacterized protein YndB with AHSA1/START domain